MPSTTEIGDISPDRTSCSSPSSASPSPVRETSDGQNSLSTKTSNLQISSAVSKVDPLYIQRARVTRLAAPKPAQNPMQFVQVKPCGLFQSARDQLKQAEDIRKAKEAEEKEIRRRSELSEPEDWQNNLDSWKSSRRKRVEHIIDRVVEVKKLEMEEFDRCRRKSKTFSEMMEERGSRRKVSLPPVYNRIEDENNDLSDLGIGSASGKSSLESDCDSQNDETSEIMSPQSSQQHLAQSSCGSSSLGDGEEEDFLATDGEQYTYESAIQGYKSRISKSNQMNPKTVVNVDLNNTKKDGLIVSEKMTPTIFMSLREEKKVEVDSFKEQSKNNYEERSNEFTDTSDTNESKFDVPKISDFKLRKLVFEKGLEMNKANESNLESTKEVEDVDDESHFQQEINVDPKNDQKHVLLAENNTDKYLNATIIEKEHIESTIITEAQPELQNIVEKPILINNAPYLETENNRSVSEDFEENQPIVNNHSDLYENGVQNETSFEVNSDVLFSDVQEEALNDTTTVMQALEIALEEIDKKHCEPSGVQIKQEAIMSEPIYENTRMPPLGSTFMAVQETPILLPFNIMTSPTNMEPPSEKPPPPPVDDEDIVDAKADTTNTFRRQNSTQRIKNDLRNKRFSFLGLEPVEIDISDVVKEPQIQYVNEDTQKQQDMRLKMSSLKMPVSIPQRDDLEINDTSFEDQIKQQEQVLQNEKELLHLEQEELRRQRLSLFSRKDELLRNKSQMRFEENKRRSMPNLQSEFKLNYFFNPIKLNQSSDRQLAMSKSTEEFFPDDARSASKSRRFSGVQQQDFDVSEKRRKNPLNYQKHWLIQEAEQRRIDQERGLQRQSTNNINKYSMTSHPQQTQKDEGGKPLPDAIIKTLTQRVQSRMVGERRLSRDADLIQMQQHFQTPTVKRQNDAFGDVNDHVEMLSVSGKKKCSSCGEELGHGAAMIIESLRLFYHLECFRCCVCFNKLGDGFSGADVRIRSQKKLHCHNCFSSDDGIKFSCV